MVHSEMLTLNDAILVISGKPKVLSSTMGHQSMESHPFAGSRIIQAGHNLVEAINALTVNDFEKLCTVAECEALTLHALLMSASPGTLLMKPATVEVIHRVVEARKNGLPVFFTLDAGANVHVMYQDVSASGVEKFIADALQPLCENGRVIFDRCGPGPIRLNGNAQLL
jgi:diphosphomevalonate decarboxylase